MNYPEELRERYNEVMFDERDIIEKFLKDQYDIRYGRQRDTWHFEPAVKMMNIYGNEIHITDVMLDKDVFVKFIGTFCNEHDEYECFHFAYGELSKVIEALPNADEIVKENAIDDIATELELSGNIVWTTGQKHIVGDGFDVLMVTGKGYDAEVILRKCDVNSEPIKLKNLSVMELKQLRDHINIEVLHRSNEYKELMGLLSLQENLRFECHNFKDAEFEIDETDMTVDVSAVQRDDKGNLVIYGADLDADEDFEFTEKDIKPRYLASIIECMKPKYTDIMDTYNGHNKELVRKINAAWKDAKYHNSFSEILLALLVRDHEEYLDKYCEIEDYSGDWAMEHAHEIMEGVCDDWDLKTILSFIRYEE